MLPIHETRRLSRRLKRALAGIMPFEFFWRIFYRVGEHASDFNPLPVSRRLPDGPVDLVISTGPRTAPASIAIARRLRARNVHYGVSKWPSDVFFTLLLTSERADPHPHRAYAMRPSEIDAAELPDARPLAANGAGRRASLLFGGPLKRNPYTMADMEILAERLAALSRDMPWLGWTVYDSRRTPKAEFDRLVEVVRSDGAPIEFVRFSDEGLLSNRAAFASDLVLVTADSMSMLTESIAARRPTGILFADAFEPPKRDANEQQALIAERRAFRVTFSGLSADAILNGAAGVEALQGSQLDDLCATLARHGI